MRSTRLYTRDHSHTISLSQSRILPLSFSWWGIVQDLTWSLLEQPQKDNFNSVDGTSARLALTLYAIFLLVGVILLVNMMIALLSNTYQTVEVRHLSQFIFPTPGNFL